MTKSLEENKSTTTVSKNKKRFKIFSFWKGSHRDRSLLFGIIAGIFLLIKLVEKAIPSKFAHKFPSDISLALLAVLVLITVIHGFYIFIAQHHRRRNPRELQKDFRPSIDIFISALNEEAVIAKTLENLLRLNYPDLKIYAINDRSTDRTKEIIDALAVKSEGKITGIHRPSHAAPGKSAALNDALKVSNGEVICVLDADAVIDDNFLFNIVTYLGDPQVAAVQAQKVISNPEVNFLTRCQFHEYAMDAYLQMGRDSIRGTVELRGNGQLVKREALEDVGGWNEETITDDLDLSTCLHVNGWDVRFSPENMVFEEGVPNLDGFIKQRRRWAEGSMRRYLNYFLQLLQPGNLSMAQIFDTFVFLSEFSVPFWLFLDISYELVTMVLNKESSFSFSIFMMISVMMTLYLFATQFNGLRIYKNQSVWQAFTNSIVGITYFLMTWMFVIMLSYRKILFSRTVGTWTRTTKGSP
jgi:1,2-diacylglycerol 3-beta-glucosyltransferase